MSSSTSRLATALLLLTSLAAVSVALAEDYPRKIASVEGITEYELENGLRVLIFPDRSQEKITVNVTYDVGSRHEAYGETGMAHLLEHMLFKGTPKHPDIPDELTKHGASPNGSTWFDRTNYFETFTATEENLDWALDLEADRMVNSFVAQKDLDTEMTVVRNEWDRGENSPFSVLMKRTLATAFQWHNYGHSTIGARSDIENVPIERLQAFYRKYYQPDNALLMVAGRLDEAKTLKKIQQTFGKIPRPERKGLNLIYPTYTREPAQDGERGLTLKRVGDTQLVMAIYHMPPGAHEEFAAVDVITNVLSERPGGRLYQALVKDGIASSVGAFNFQLKEPGVLLAYAELQTTDSIDKAREILLQTIDGIALDPPSEKEIARARNRLVKQLELSFKNSASVARGISEWASRGDWRMFFIHRDRIKEVTQAQVQAVAQKYFRPSNSTVGLFIPADSTPERAEMPEVPDVSKLVAEYKGGEALVAGEEFDPSPENIEARSESYVAAPGLRVALLTKKNRGESVRFSLSIRMGTKESLWDKDLAGSLAAAMLMRGSTEHDRQAIRDELDALKSTLGFGGSGSAVSASSTTDRDNLPALLALVSEILHKPAFDSGEFSSLVKQTITDVESSKSDPNSKAALAMGRLMDPLPKGHPDYYATIEERLDELDAITLAQVRDFYGKFYDGADIIISIVGDFDAEAIKPQLPKLFAPAGKGVKYERFSRAFSDTPATRIQIETPDKTNAILLAKQNINMRDDDPDYPALLLANYMLGGGFLNSRIATRIRQKEGLSYGAGSGIRAHSVDARASLTAYAIYAPENRAAVERAMREEIQKAVAEGFSDQEVNDARNGFLDHRRLSRNTDGALAGLLSGNLFAKRDMNYTAKLEQAIRDLTTAELNAAFARHIDPDKISVVVAGDFEKQKNN